MVRRPLFLAGFRGALRHDPCRCSVCAFLENEFWTLGAANAMPSPSRFRFSRLRRYPHARRPRCAAAMLLSYGPGARSTWEAPSYMPFRTRLPSPFLAAASRSRRSPRSPHRLLEHQLWELSPCSHPWTSHFFLASLFLDLFPTPFDVMPKAVHR